MPSLGRQQSCFIFPIVFLSVRLDAALPVILEKRRPGCDLRHWHRRSLHRSGARGRVHEAGAPLEAAAAEVSAGGVVGGQFQEGGVTAEAAAPLGG